MRNPRANYIAYRIWAYATPREWNVTIYEISDEIDENWRTICNICIHKGWLGRLRQVSAHNGVHYTKLYSSWDVEDAIHDLGAIAPVDFLDV